MSEDYAAPVYSNLKRSTLSYDDELPITPEMQAAYDSIPVMDASPTDQDVEIMLQEYEKNYHASASQRWPGQERWQGKENEEMRLVRIMHPHQVFARLRKAGIDARIESPYEYIYVPDGKTGKIVPRRRETSTGRLWLHDEVKGGRCGISAWVYDWRTGERRRKMVTSLQYPYGPEWSIMRFNEYNVPTNERYRGWRTAMLALMIDRVLSEDEVNRAFGPVILNRASELYRQTIQHHRKTWAGIVPPDGTEEKDGQTTYSAGRFF
jgi:hypothetical protein